MPVTSIPRDDGGTQHLLFVYVTIGAGNQVSATPNWSQFNGTAIYRGRDHYGLWAKEEGIDCSPTPAGVAWRNIGSVRNAHGAWPSFWTSFFCIQYLSPTPGIQVVSAGDSLAVSPTTDSFATPVWQACMDISNLSTPIAFASLAAPGWSSTKYLTHLRMNEKSLRPSIVALQPYSRDDGNTPAALRASLAACLATFEAMSSPCCQMFWAMLGLEPIWETNPDGQNAFLEIQARLSRMVSNGGAPVVDASQAISELVRSGSGNPWNYGVGLSDDGTHPNMAGSSLLVPAVREIIRRML